MACPALHADPAAEGWQLSCRVPTGVLLAGAPERLSRHRVAAAPDMAMAGGTQPERLLAAMESVAVWAGSHT